jgi:hypothetical protein
MKKALELLETVTEYPSIDYLKLHGYSRKDIEQLITIIELARGNRVSDFMRDAEKNFGGII